MKTLSIIIPAYNVEKYLDEAVAPYLHLHETNNIEILIINDGSKDNTFKMALEYEKQYPNLIKVIDKENGGHGSTINTGVDHAQGKYFKVVDGDDWVDQKALISMLENLAVLDSDMVVTGFQIVSEETGEKENIRIQGVEYGREYRFAEICNKIDYIRMHSIFFKTEIFKNNKIKLDENCFYVDVEHDILPLKWIDTVTFYDELFYQYRIGRPGQSVNFQAMIKNRENHFRVLKRVIDYRKRNNFPDSVDRYIRNKILSLVNIQYSILFAMSANRESKKELVEFDRWLLKEENDIYCAIEQKKICFMRSMKFCNYFLVKLLYKVLQKKEMQYVK